LIGSINLESARDQAKFIPLAHKPKTNTGQVAKLAMGLAEHAIIGLASDIANCTQLMVLTATSPTWMVLSGYQRSIVQTHGHRIDMP